jgi:hypothetical protein
VVLSTNVITAIETSVSALPLEEQEKLARYGALVLAREMEGRLELAKRKLAEFERKYGMNLDRLNQVGLPENAGREEHEDWVEWSSWQGTQEETLEVLNHLRAILEATDAGHLPQ